MISLVFFHGPGKSTLTFNVAHMIARQGRRVVLIDCDPQCDLTALLLDEDTLATIMEEPAPSGQSVASCVSPAIEEQRPLRAPTLCPVADNLWLLPGDPALGRFEPTLGASWATAHRNDPDALRAITSLALLAESAARLVDADVLLVDASPNLGALSRSALLACDAVVLPLMPAFSVRALAPVGSTLRFWRDEWHQMLNRHAAAKLPRHAFQPLGYVMQEPILRSHAADYRWLKRVPEDFHRHVLDEPEWSCAGIDSDPSCIAWLRHLASLAPLAQASRKPFFDLKQADGIGSGQLETVARARREIDALARELLTRAEQLPPLPS